MLQPTISESVRPASAGSCLNIIYMYTLQVYMYIHATPLHRAGCAQAALLLPGLVLTPLISELVRTALIGDTTHVRVGAHRSHRRHNSCQSWCAPLSSETQLMSELVRIALIGDTTHVRVGAHRSHRRDGIAQQLSYWVFLDTAHARDSVARQLSCRDSAHVDDGNRRCVMSNRRLLDGNDRPSWW
jgi:hypothetical protein